MATPLPLSIALRMLLRTHPTWSSDALADALNRSVSWVKKWRARFREAAPTDETVLR